MWVRIKPSRSSGERDRTITTEYGGEKYTVGFEPVNVSAEVGKYLTTSFSSQVESVNVSPEAEAVATPDTPSQKQRLAKKAKNAAKSLRLRR
tara:strand:- start:71 stop:346 length:276 start_codon:yes stop_codon:yes gene_type:complete